MVDLLEYRVSELARQSSHWRRLADGFLPLAVNAEIAAIADECDREVRRMEQECRGKRSCPCERLGSCLPVE